MPRTSEIRHYSLLLAALTISAARCGAEDPKKLAELLTSLAEAYLDIFTLLSHDARALRAEAVDVVLQERAERAAGTRA